ncbi:hypothetical protein JKP88DRAFT_249141 [Tribonema minus]|uniref:Uncharacterized protein n=1 Tax=Tribonema minus TaxID=303371 RepID=A0A836C8G2_9STRA|nr:hypothetical protein JKP88DRAFT_249141 [Tribonema minus]
MLRSVPCLGALLVIVGVASSTRVASWMTCAFEIATARDTELNLAEIYMMQTGTGVANGFAIELFNASPDHPAAYCIDSNFTTACATQRTAATPVEVPINIGGDGGTQTIVSSAAGFNGTSAGVFHSAGPHLSLLSFSADAFVTDPAVYGVYGAPGPRKFCAGGMQLVGLRIATTNDSREITGFGVTCGSSTSVSTPEFTKLRVTFNCPQGVVQGYSAMIFNSRSCCQDAINGAMLTPFNADGTKERVFTFPDDALDQYGVQLGQTGDEGMATGTQTSVCMYPPFMELPATDFPGCATYWPSDGNKREVCLRDYRTCELKMTPCANVKYTGSDGGAVCMDGCRDVPYHNGHGDGTLMCLANEDDPTPCHVVYNDQVPVCLTDVCNARVPYCNKIGFCPANVSAHWHTRCNHDESGSS